MWYATDMYFVSNEVGPLLVQPKQPDILLFYTVSDTTRKTYITHHISKLIDRKVWPRDEFHVNKLSYATSILICYIFCEQWGGSQLICYIFCEKYGLVTAWWQNPLNVHAFWTFQPSLWTWQDRHWRGLSGTWMGRIGFICYWNGVYTFMPWLCVDHMIQQGVWPMGFSSPDPLTNPDPLAKSRPTDKIQTHS